MALQAAAVEILIEKAKFEAPVALGIAEAIEATIMNAQLVTIPVLDARLLEFKAEIRQVRTELDAKIERVKADLELKVEGVGAELLVKMEAIKSELVRWVFLTMLGNVALSAGVAAILKHL